MTPPPAPPRPHGPFAQQMYEALRLAVGLWPLTAVMLLGFGLLCLSGLYASP